MDRNSRDNYLVKLKQEGLSVKVNLQTDRTQQRYCFKSVNAVVNNPVPYTSEGWGKEP